MVGSLRRTKSVPASGGEESLSSRKRTVTGSGSDNDSKSKQDPLPDILTDWEIIVKSLREDEKDSTDLEILKAPKLKPARSIKKSSTPKLIQINNSLKGESTNIDQENLQLVKKKLIETKPIQNNLEDSVHLATSSYLFSPVSLKKSHKPTDTSPNDDSDPIWRRPTRSTYKAFETIFDSPELEDIPLKCELTGGDEKEIDALKALFTPEKEILPQKIKFDSVENIIDHSKFPLKIRKLNKAQLWRKQRVNEFNVKGKPRKIQLSKNFKEKITKRIKDRNITKRNIQHLGFKEKNLKKENNSEENNHSGGSCSRERSTSRENTSIREKKIKIRERKINIRERRIIIRERRSNIRDRKSVRERRNLRERRITRGFVNKGQSVEDKDSAIINKSPCKQLIVKIENLKFPRSPEMDFIGFGTQPSPKKKLLKSPNFSDESKVEIESVSAKSLNIISDVEDTPSNNIDCKPFEEKDVSETSLQLPLTVASTKHENHETIDTTALEEFNLYFGSEEEALVNDFEGFNLSFKNQKTCLKCSLVVNSLDTLKHHIKVGHKKIYPCPFDTGECEKSKGAVNFHNHLISIHGSLISFLQEYLSSDIQNKRVTHYIQNSVGCGVCLMPLDQPLRCIHEMLVHGIWPPSILNLSPVAIDQHASLWWTGRSLTFACHLCHSPENSAFTKPIISSAPHCFPMLLANHVRNVHLLNLPLLQGWYLMFKLLLSLPAFPRRTLATMIALGVDTQSYYANCTLCGKNLKFYANMNLNQPGGLCKKCDFVCMIEKKCWFACKSINIGVNNSILNHMLIDHPDESVCGWCITCGLWSSNLIIHIKKCSQGKLVCKICVSKKISDMTDLNKVWHSLSAHSFFCPIPMCSSYSSDKKSIPKFFSTPFHLFNHVLSQHLPEWSRLSLEQMSSLIFSSKKMHGFVLTAPSAEQLNGTWIGVSGHQYSLQGNILAPKETVQVSLICLLCSREWNESVAYTCKEGGAICSECTLVLSQYQGKSSIEHCPVFKCIEDVSSMDELCQHLVETHDLCPISKKMSCSYCGPVSLASPLSAVIHNILNHKIACLLCPFTAPTAAQIFAHRATMHGLPTWDAVFQHLKMEENSRTKKRPDIVNGIVRVWDGECGTYSLWDQSLAFSNLQVSELEDETCGIISQSIQETGHIIGTSREATMVDQWCSSVCSVSMSSPSKNAFDVVPTEKDIKPDISQLSENLAEDIPMASVSPHLLVPVISVGNNGQSDSSEDSDDALEIDSGAHSDGSTGAKIENLPPIVLPASIGPTKPVQDNFSKVRSSRSSRSLTQQVNNTKPFGFVDVLNNVMEDSLNSMNRVLSSNPVVSKSNGNDTPKTPLNSYSKSKKSDHSKGLAENACFDEKSMAENILKDLDEKYCATCVGCSANSIQLSDLKVHINSIHPNKVVYCGCGYIAELYNALVHSFHMSHIPNEARPIIFKNSDGTDQSMIVLEARSDLKSMTYPCYKCFKRFKQEKSRQLHYNLCKLEKKFDCDICGEKFALDNHLQKHKEWKHNPQICKHCSKTFTSSSSLAQHILHLHKRPLSHNCKQCGDAFNTSKQLKVHLRVHSGIQPHACSHCSNTFISRNLLRKHIIKIHKNLSNEDGFKLKMNGASSSSDSSDSDDSDSDTRRKSKRNLSDFNKVLALTESDLNTSNSETDESLPKKLKTMMPIKKVIIKDPPTTPHREPDLKSGKAGIYQDQGVVSLPEMRSNLRNRVESTVGRVCAPCSQEFESTTAKLLHMYLIHPGLVLTLGFNECSFCQHKFTSADDVSNHHLDKHQRTALPNGNFRCLCGLVFREDGAYYFHLYYAHKAQRALNIGGEIVCRVCDGRPRLNKIVDLVVHLSDRHTMFDHVRFNDSYMCNFCYKAFESWTVLSLHFFMVHKATKSQTLSYDCPFCKGASPWHSLEALQYHLDNVHRGRHTQSRPVPEHSRSIYTPAPVPSSPTKRKESTPIKPLQIKRNRKPLKQKIKDDQQQVLYCVCRCPYDQISDMIGCDNDDCKFQWFHFKCVGINAAPEGNWYCPDCQEMKNQKQKQQHERQPDLYEYYSTSNYNNDPKDHRNNRSRNHSSSSSSSSNSSSSSSSNSSSSSSSSSNDSSSGSGEEN